MRTDVLKKNINTPFPAHSTSKSTHRRPWLKSVCFHNCLLACAFEVILFASKVPGLTFPAVLGVFKVSAWAFFKVIESAVRQGNFPRPIKVSRRRKRDLQMDTEIYISFVEKVSTIS